MLNIRTLDLPEVLKGGLTGKSEVRSIVRKAFNFFCSGYSFKWEGLA